MEPNPKTFLPAMYHELHDRATAVAHVPDDGLRVFLGFATEALAHLEVRQNVCAGWVGEFCSRYEKLLIRTSALLADYECSVPQQLGSASTDCEDVSIRSYESIAGQVAASIAALSSLTERKPALAKEISVVCKEVFDIEQTFAQRYERSVSEAKAPREPLSDAVELPEISAEQVRRYLRKRFPQYSDIEAKNLRRLVTVSSKEIYALEIENYPNWPGPSILRRAPLFNLAGTRLAQEFALMRYVRELGLPVPRTLLSEDDPDAFGNDIVVMEHVTGQSKTAIELGPSGKSIALRGAEILAMLHDAPIPNLPQFADAQLASETRMLRAIEGMYQRWRKERLEGSVVLEATNVWLRANVHLVGPAIAMVHGDFDFRNILIENGRISHVLDWELCHVSNPAEDIAYCSLDVKAVMDWTEFVGHYNAHAKRPVDLKAVEYFEIWVLFWRSVIAVITYSGYQKRAHQSFPYLWYGIETVRRCSAELSRLLSGKLLLVNS